METQICTCVLQSVICNFLLLLIQRDAQNLGIIQSHTCCINKDLEMLSVKIPQYKILCCAFFALISTNI